MKIKHATFVVTGIDAHASPGFGVSDLPDHLPKCGHLFGNQIVRRVRTNAMPGGDVLVEVDFCDIAKPRQIELR